MVDAGLGQRLLDGPLRWTPESLPPNPLPAGERRARFSPSGALVTYFHGTPRQFSGSLFDSIGGGGDRSDVENQITREDVFAVAAVNAPVPAAVASLLLNEPASGRLATLLRQLPTDIDLWDAEDETLAIATKAWDEIRTIHEAGTTFGADGGFAANKLLARKRPRLIPLYDEKVRAVVYLVEGASWWFSLRDALRVDGEDNEVRFRVGAAMLEAKVGYVSVLRGLDVILWSYASFGGSKPK
ncbi:MAG: hypothetical protein HHJ11_17125 [Phycicoccus sp.]|nr:hypothetical protein [Phycicoccus sp.]NMM32741.1 hypothetical protein [Phycicoccus sp.]